MGRMSEIKKGFSVILVLMLLSSSFLGIACGDGGIIGKMGNVFYIKEESQYAVINYLNGKQKMLISVDFNWMESEKTAWIFPIPSDPDYIEIDIADGAPGFWGTDVISEAQEDLKDSKDLLLFPYLATAMVPLAPLLFFSISGMMSGSAGVDVHKTCDKYGLTAEVISASQGVGIYQYLNNNDLEIDEGSIPQLDDYIKEDYSFVVTWISDVDKLAMSPGIIIEFPTKDMFFPLILTSIYEIDIIPIEVIVAGHVTPKIYKDIEPYSKVRYWEPAIVSRASYYSSSEAENFTREIRGSMDKKFTSIEINSPSIFFSKDLWIENKAPDKIGYAKAIHQNFGHGAAFIWIYVISSLTIGLLLGLFIFGKNKKDIPFYLFIGGGNAIGLIGMIIFTGIFLRIVNKKREEENQIAREKGLIFIFFFVITFIFTMWFILSALTLPLL